MTENVITIIGGGLIGLATAFELASAGQKVRVLDPAPLSGASYWAAGMLAPTAEMVYRQDGLFPLMDDSAARYPDLVARVEQVVREGGGMPDGSDPDCAMRREGTLVVGGDVGDRALLQELTAFQQRFGKAVEWLPTRQARRLEPALSPQITAGVWIPDDHQIDPRRFGAVLLRALELLDVPLINQPGTKDMLGPNTIVAAGLGALDLLPTLPLRPVYGDIVRLRDPYQQQAHNQSTQAHNQHTQAPLLTRVVRAFVCGRHVYLVPRADGELVVGATSREDGRAVPQAGGVLDLLRDAELILPGIRDLDVVQVGAGARPGTPDDLPLIGRDPDSGAIVLTGFFRHGILLTAWGAALGAALARGTLDPTQQMHLSSCDPWRFA